MYLSDVFKYTQGLGQKGHQIGRKVGDAIEILTLGMVNLDRDLNRFLVIEEGIEGATGAKHKVEFSFFNHLNGVPSKIPENLFGLIECKKVGVEQTVKSNFKAWGKLSKNKTDFNLTHGYSFTISPSNANFRWGIHVSSTNTPGKNLKITTIKKERFIEDDVSEIEFTCDSKSQVLIALDADNKLYIFGSNEYLSRIVSPLKNCIIIQIESVLEGNVTSINVNESLAGPQTPEKAKQASFVSLDVRKKVLGQFDKTDNKSFISVLVIGEASHWEGKSRSMIRLCNDHNLVIPDRVLVYLFNEFEKKFGDHSQDRMTKTFYKTSQAVRDLIAEIIIHFEEKILKDMDTKKYVKFKYQAIDGTNRLIIEEMVEDIVEVGVEDMVED